MGMRINDADGASDGGQLLSFNDPNNFDILWGSGTAKDCKILVRNGGPQDVCGGKKFIWTCGRRNEEIASAQFSNENGRLSLFIQDSGIAPQFTPQAFLTIVSAVIAVRRDLSACTRIPNANTMMIKNRKNLNFCLHNPADGDDNAFPNVIHQCDNSVRQEWTFADDQIKSHNGHCLDVRSGSLSPGSIVGTYGCWTWFSSPNQMWEHRGDQTIRIKSKPHLCLDVQSGEMRNWASTVLSSCNGSPSQKWELSGNV